MRIKVDNRSGRFGVYISPVSGKKWHCGCTMNLENQWADWAIETHTLLRNTIGLE